VSVRVNDISMESFLCYLLFMGIESELQREGVWVEGKETGQSGIVRCVIRDWDGDV